MIAAGFSGGHTAGEFLLQYAMTLAGLVLYGTILLCFFGRNYLAYGLWLWSASLAKAVYELASQPSSPLQIQGWITAAFLLLTMVWAVLPALMAVRSLPASSGTRITEAGGGT